MSSNKEKKKKKRAASGNEAIGHISACFVWVLPSNNLGHSHKVHRNKAEEILRDVIEEGVLVVEILSYKHVRVT